MKVEVEVKVDVNVEVGVDEYVEVEVDVNVEVGLVVVLVITAHVRSLGDFVNPVQGISVYVSHGRQAEHPQIV